MSILRSSNCSAYTDHVSLLVTSTATVPGEEDKCTVHLPATFSCQTSAFEGPDEATAADIHARAATALDDKGCDASRMVVDAQTNLVGTQASEYTGEKLSTLGMASNCFVHGNDPNDATHIAKARCHPMYDMTDSKGRTVRDYHMRISSSLATCDMSDEAMPQLMEDVRKVAAYNLSQSGYTLKRPEDLACDLGILPRI